MNDNVCEIPEFCDIGKTLLYESAENSGNSGNWRCLTEEDLEMMFTEGDEKFDKHLQTCKICQRASYREGGTQHL